MVLEVISPSQWIEDGVKASQELYLARINACKKEWSWGEEVAIWGKWYRGRGVWVGSKRAGYTDSESIIRTAAALELFHLGTLVHDDIQDGDICRRGKMSLWQSIGMSRATWIGDWLMAEAFHLLNDYSPCLPVLRSLISIAPAMCRAQGRDLRGIMDERTYWEVIRDKSGLLIAIALSAGARLKADRLLENRLYPLGEEVGIAYQLCDDLNDKEETRILCLSGKLKNLLARQIKKVESLLSDELDEELIGWCRYAWNRGG